MGNLITGILLLAIGVVLSMVLPMPKFDTAEFEPKKALYTMFRCNVWGSLLTMLGIFRLALYSLNLTDADITLKNGIFLFAAILSISNVIERIIIKIRLSKDTKERKTKTVTEN
ncbi:MAG: hypothetical protein IKT84_01235 [Bacteroidales bacterium]|nr:hypothetical protein [Bacteroidales bacterium]